MGVAVPFGVVVAALARVIVVVAQKVLRSPGG
jgi:hypothetical protein